MPGDRHRHPHRVHHRGRQASRRRSGVALLEVLVALTILATAGLAATVMTSESTDAMVRARATDAALREASAFLDAVALWSREDLDRRLGDHEQGPWRLHLARPTPTLYVVALTDSLGRRVLLETMLYRPEAPRAETPAVPAVRDGGD